MTLLPGDVIATGTPSGVGRPRGIFLQPGDRVRIEISGIGTLENSVVRGE
jgi:2-keto-4-pentenoate hydratase/2-oxohepta-3-ene-1,7-dioic acid hydratase in catechol pathway